MSLSDRFEQVGIVVGSALLFTLPMSALSPFLVDDPSLWQTALLWYSPGTLVGLLVATDRLPISYGQVFTFTITAWLTAAVLWMVFEVPSVTAKRPMALGSFVVALLVGTVLAWANPRVEWVWDRT
ncbi:hypothetical protein [Haladaptatus sp. NG-WS-4]